MLRDFVGTILFVSHDRYLIDALATQIWVIEGERLRVYKGDYQEYLALRQREQEEARRKQEAERLAEARRLRGTPTASRSFERGSGVARAGGGRGGHCPARTGAARAGRGIGAGAFRE